EGGRGGLGPWATGRLSVAPAWEAPTGSVVASPVITRRLVLCLTASGVLLFLDRATGRVLFERRLGGPVESSPALAGGVLHVGTDDGELVGIDARSASEAYRAKVGQLVRSSPR